MTMIVDEFSTFEEKLQARSANTEHLTFQLGDLAFNAGRYPSVKIQDKDYSLSDSSFRQIAEQMNIPVPYAKRIPDDLLAYTVNYFLKERKDHHVSALTDGYELRSFMKVNTPYVSNVEMFDAVKDALDGQDYDLKYAKVTDTRTSFSILPSNYRESIDGSNLYGGIKVVYSDAWDIHPSIDSYIWRELCSNGMVNELENRKFRVTNAPYDDVIRQIRDFSALAIDKLPELFENFGNLLDEKVADYVQILTRIVLEYKLPNKVLTRLLFWAVNPDFLVTISNEKIENMHDIVNLVTYAGSHDGDLTPEIRQRLLEIGGNLTLNHTDRCGSCGSSV